LAPSKKDKTVARDWFRANTHYFRNQRLPSALDHLRQRGIGTMRKAAVILATVATLGATLAAAPAEARYYRGGGWGWGPGIGFGIAAGALTAGAIAAGAYGPYGYGYGPGYGYYGPRYVYGPGPYAYYGGPRYYGPRYYRPRYYRYY